MKKLKCTGYSTIWRFLIADQSEGGNVAGLTGSSLVRSEHRTFCPNNYKFNTSVFQTKYTKRYFYLIINNTTVLSSRRTINQLRIIQPSSKFHRFNV